MSSLKDEYTRRCFQTQQLCGEVLIAITPSALPGSHCHRHTRLKRPTWTQLEVWESEELYQAAVYTHCVVKSASQKWCLKVEVLACANACWFMCLRGLQECCPRWPPAEANTIDETANTTLVPQGQRHHWNTVGPVDLSLSIPPLLVGLMEGFELKNNSIKKKNTLISSWSKLFKLRQPTACQWVKKG